MTKETDGGKLTNEEPEPSSPPSATEAVSVPPETATTAIVPHRASWLLAGLLSTLATLLLLFLLASRLYVYDALPPLHPAPAPEEASAKEKKALAKEIRTLQEKTRRARRNLEALEPASVYIVVDTARNKLYVKRRGKTLHEAVCSTGSGGLLKDPNEDRQWVFETPRGTFRVLRKAEDPVWTKPDWAFVEEGKAVPSEWSERRDYDTLGDYALYFGDGYMIHGTLYQRYLGRAITHGCVRLGDADLERVYHMAPVGTPILIF